jgi:leucyl/phenylalanyl-tRNA--protein transferase
MIILRPGKSDLRFPPVEAATPEGLLAIGGDLTSERLLEAYRHGIFPWYNPGQPILWWSPDPRAVLYPEKLRISRSLRKTLRRGHFRVRFDTAFREVVLACAAPRANSSGTWITDDMVTAYCRLHELGFAHSIETWADERLVGGLYGVALGGVFFGESMFARATDASKAALVALVKQLRAWGFGLVDCQVPSEHLTSLGAENIPRSRFLHELAAGLRQPGHPGRWSGEITGPELIGAADGKEQQA